MPGPLTSLSVVEIAGLGPGPYCGQVLADMGADVVRVDRMDSGPIKSLIEPSLDFNNRGKRSIAVDLKQPDAVDIVLRLAERSDALIEGFRPGVTERLGIGPDDCLARNPALVYGRMTGWGQDGPLAKRAGHDIDYLALSGTLAVIGTREKPIVPLNLVADFGGGGMMLAFGVLAGVLEAKSSGVGQVIDAAMVDGVAHLSTMLHSMIAAEMWGPQRQNNLLDGGAPFYDTYKTADGRHMAVGALEPQFFAALLQGLDLNPAEVGEQMDTATWPDMRLQFEDAFLRGTRDEWEQRFAHSDGCVAPVLDPSEVMEHPHLRARGTFVELDGNTQPSPAPRFSRTVPDAPTSPPDIGSHTQEILADLGYTADEADRLRFTQVVR